METFGSAEQRRSGLLTYCYCNYRLLRAVQIASTDETVEQIGLGFSPSWINSLADSKEAVMSWAQTLQTWKVKRMVDKRWWQPSNRTTRLDMSKFPGCPKWIVRLLYGQNMDAFLYYWLSSNAEFLPYRILKDGTWAMQLSDPRSPGTYEIEFIVEGKRFRIDIIGVKATRARRRKRKGRTVQVSQALEQTQTAEVRSQIDAAMESAKKVHSMDVQFGDESVDRSL